MPAAGVFVHEITLPGGGGTYLYSTGAIVTEAADTPANYPVLPVIDDPGTVRQQLFSGGRAPGLVTPQHGEVSYFNDARPGQAGRFDAWVLLATDGGKVTCRYGIPGAAYPGEYTVDFVAYIDGSPEITTTRMKLRLRDRSALFARPIITEGFAASGGLQGTDVAGERLRQRVYGDPGYYSPILISPFEGGHNVWYLQKNATTASGYLYDGGVRLTQQADYSSSADLFDSGTVPSPASWRKWEGPEGVYVRLGSKCRLDLRAHGWNAAASAPTISAMAIEAGATGAGTMATGSVDMRIGKRVLEQQSFRDLFEDVARANLSIIGFNTVDQFSQRYITPSFENDYITTVTFTDGANSKEWQCAAPSGMQRRAWEVRLRAGATKPGQLAGIPDLHAEAAEVLSREQWITQFRGSATSVLNEDASAETATVEIQSNEFASSTSSMFDYCYKYLRLFGSIQQWVWLVVDYTVEMAALQLLDRVNLSSSRFMLSPSISGPQRGRVASIERNLKARKIRFGIWCHRQSIVTSADVSVGKIDDAFATTGAGATSRGTRLIRPPECFVIACSDNTTALAVGVVKTIPNFPYSLRLVGIELGLRVAQATGALLTVDVKVNGVSVLSTLATLDNTETKSNTAATQPVLSKYEILKGDKVEFEITQLGATSAARGLTVNLLGYQ